MRLIEINGAGINRNKKIWVNPEMVLAVYEASDCCKIYFGGSGENLNELHIGESVETVVAKLTGKEREAE